MFQNSKFVVRATLSALFLVLVSTQSLSAGDTRRPKISNVRATQVTATSAVITWTTNEPASSQVKYGKTTSYGSVTPLSTALVTSHAVLLSSLTDNTTHYYRAMSKDAAGNLQTSYNYSFRTLAAAVAPSAPSSTAATAASGSRIDVSWTDNSSNETGFYVYQSADGANFSQVGSTGANVRTYAAQNLQSQKTYYYRVRSYNATGNSADSNTASATTLGTVPGNPLNLSAAAASSARIDLAWTDNSSDESGFYVYQSTDGTNYSQIASVNANVSSYAVQNLQSQKTYHYRVRSYNTTGSSADSNTATATTQGGPPSAPTNLSAAAISTSEIDLSWTDNASDESGFYVYRSTDGSNFSHVATLNANTISYSSQSLQAETTYYYFVCAYNAVDNSLDSNIANATTNGNSAPAKAFPGAVGFGIDTPGGRGGAILKVTNLNDSGAGSLRAALGATGPRTVIFEVSGTINLLSELRITSPFVTIAGQTAPSPGITLKGGEFNIKTHDVIVQHIRVRLGDQLPSGTDPGGADTLSTEGPAYNVIMDHVSASWGIDENGTTWYDDLRDVTFSNCIVSEALYNSIHPKGAHSMGLLVTPNGRNVAMIGNLLAHNSDRNPLISNGSSSVVANNVFYNWVGGRATNVGNYSSSFPQKYPTEVSIIGNVYIKGYNTTSSTNAISTSTSLSAGAKIYVADNVLVGITSVWRNVVAYNPLVSSPPVQVPGYTPMNGSSVEASVLNNAGARPADRDEVDHRIVHEVNTRTGRLINSQSEVGGWPTLAVNQRTINVPANANADDDGDGYTNFEEQVLFPMAAAVEGN